MNSPVDDASESSLPTQHVHPIRSSPPIAEVILASAPVVQSQPSPASPFVQADWSFLSMEKSPLKPEPQLTQDTKPVPKTASSEDKERPPSAQQQHVNSDEHASDDDTETEDDEMTLDPAAQIEALDWDNLMMRYHDAMKGCHDEEGALTQEWESLMNFFRIWAASGHDHETDRTFQRLRTRTTYVQHSEDKLEQTRNHYINVVKAFESALNLLKVPAFGG